MKKKSFSSRFRFLHLKKAGICSVLFFSMAIPTPAFAFQSLMQIALTKAAEYMQVLAKEGAMIAQWTYDKTQNLLTSQSGFESIVAAVEKQLAGNKELTQAEINYEAADASRRRYENAQDNFMAESSRAYNTCETLAAGSAISGASDDARDIVRSGTQAAVQRGLHTENSTASAREVVARYKDKYCSAKDVERGFCLVAAPALMQSASVHASTLLNPAAGETYTAEEAEAAADFIVLLTNPFPDEMLPKALEKKNGASQAFNLALMNAQAQMSVAVYSLNEILGSRTPATAMGQNAAGETEGSISAVGLMKKFTEKRFSDADYKAKVNQMLTPALLQEFNVQMAGKNWMDYQSYLQDERIEALVATRLGVLASERNDRQLALSRSMVKR